MSKHVEEKKKRKVAAARERGNTDGSLALMTQAITNSFKSGLQDTFAPVVNEIKASNQAVLDGIEELKGLHMIQAAKEDESDDEMEASSEDESDDEMEASAEDESDDMEAAMQESDESASDESASDASELEAMEDLELEHPDQSTGEVNKDATNKGHKTTVTKPPKQGEHFKGNVAKGRLHSSAKKGAKGMKKPFPGLEAAAEQLKTIYAQKYERKVKRAIQAAEQKSSKKIKKLEAAHQTVLDQLEFFTEREARRSAIPTELVNLAAKSGVNLGEVKAAGQTLSVAAVDSMFAVAKNHGINIEPETRMAMKMQLEQEGLMENGEIERNYGRA